MNPRSLRVNRGRAAQKDSYRFTLVNNEVTNLQEFKDGRWVGEEIDRDESWSFDGTKLTKTELGPERIKTYIDPDKDGVFTRSRRDVVTGTNTGRSSSSGYKTNSEDSYSPSGSDVVTGTNTAGSSSSGYKTTVEDSYRFELVNGQVANLQEFEYGRWVGEEIDQDESWSFDGTNLIEREIDKNKIEITTYSDPDGDNIFSKVSKVYSPISDGNSYGL